MAKIDSNGQGFSTSKIPLQTMPFFVFCTQFCDVDEVVIIPKGNLSRLCYKTKYESKIIEVT
jgi:hypothetical protein